MALLDGPVFSMTNHIDDHAYYMIILFNQVIGDSNVKIAASSRKLKPRLRFRSFRFRVG